MRSIGTKLPSEAMLAERYGVPRSVVRTALRNAAQLGLTEKRSDSAVDDLFPAIAGDWAPEESG